MEEENLFILLDEEWNEGIMLNFYNETVSIIAARQYEKDGEYKTIPKFCKPERGYRKYAEQAVPMGPRMKSIKQAKEVFGTMVSHLGGTVSWNKSKKAPF